MFHEVTMPALGMTMQEGTIVKWLKKEGDSVEAGEPLLEVTTDKLTMEVESPASGTLRRIVAGEGETVPVTQLIALIGPADEPLPELARVGPRAGEGQVTAVTPVVAAGQGSEVCSAGAADEEAGRGPSGQPPRPRASPAARRLAREAGISIDQLGRIAGTGPGGRIKAADVLAARYGSTAPQPAPGAALPTGSPAVGGGMVIPVQGMRAVIARRMAESARTAASFSVSTEVDASAMVRLREETSGVLGARGIILSFTAIIVRACALALREYPALNSSFSVDGIRIHSRVNVGVAVALDDGLVVPVVRDADSKSLPSVAAEIEGFAKAARGGRLKPADLEGGTFTVSNLGMTGVTSFVPIINLPEACILGVGSVIKRPLVTAGGTVEVRPVMALNLTVDHRVTDGWQAAQFLMRVKRRLEEAASLLL